MIGNGDNLQRNTHVDIPLYTGPEAGYVKDLVTVALQNELNENHTGYRVTNGENTVRLIGEGPYSKNRLFLIAKQAILQDINSEEGKKDSPLRPSLERPFYLS